MLVTLPLLHPQHNSAHFAVDLARPVSADALAIWLTTNGVPTYADGSTVKLTRAALDRLTKLSPGANGHFNGTHVRWADVDHPVEDITIEQLTAQADGR